MGTSAGSWVPFWDELPPTESAIWEEEWSERAAIMEYHGGLSTAEAEVEAYRLVEEQFRAAADLVPLGKVGARVGMRSAPRPNLARSRAAKADDQTD